MTSTEPPEWVIRVPNARTRPIKDSNQPRLSQAQLNTFNSWGQNVAGKDELAAGSTPVAASSINGPVQTSSVGIAPATSVAVKDTNMLVSQNFTSRDTVVSAGQWSWDGDTGNITKGCARVDCNGGQDDLVSNEILVVPGENVKVTVQVKWVDITYTGTNPIVLGVEKYRKARDPDTNGTVYIDVGGADVMSLSAPASSGGWTELTGTFVVPDKGVDQLRFRFRAAATITAGIVYWDEAEFKKLDLIPDAAVPGVGTSIDNVVNNLYGQTGTGYGHADAAKAFSNTSQSLTSVSSKVASLDAAGRGGAIAGDDFAFSGEIIASTNWAGSYNPSGKGVYQADGVDAVWVPGGTVINGKVYAKFDWVGPDATSAGDYQLIQVVLDSAPAYHAISGRESGICIYGRVAADWQSYIELAVKGNGTYTVSRCVAGAVTVMGSGSCAVPGAGATISLYCGDWSIAADRKFSGDINGTPLFSFTEGTSTSLIGASNRKWGWGGYANGVPAGSYGLYYLGNSTWVSPPKVNQWLAMDQ